MEHIVRKNVEKVLCGPCFNCYADGCRCKGCRKERLISERNRRRPDSHWDNPLIDPSEVLEHMAELELQGIGTHLLAKEAGLSPTHLTNLKGGKVKRIRKQNALRILSITMSSKWSPAVGLAQRKLINAGMEGISLERISEDTGISIKTLSEIRRGKYSRMKRTTFDKIVAFNPRKLPYPSPHVIGHTKKLKQQLGV